MKRFFRWIFEEHFLGAYVFILFVPIVACLLALYFGFTKGF